MLSHGVQYRIGHWTVKSHAMRMQDHETDSGEAGVWEVPLCCCWTAAGLDMGRPQQQASATSLSNILAKVQADLVSLAAISQSCLDQRVTSEVLRLKQLRSDYTL